MTNPVLSRTFNDTNSGWASPTAEAWQNDGTSAPPPGYIASDRSFSIEGVAWKVFGLVVITMIVGSATWQYADPQTVTNRNGDVLSSSINEAVFPFAIGAMFIGLGLALVGIFKPRLARIVAPLYAVAQGIFLGAISALFESMYPGIVFQAVLGTVGVAMACAVLFATGIVKVTKGFMRVLMVAMVGIMITYGMNLVMSLFGGPDFGWVNDSGPLGIGISLFVIVIASMSLIADFHFVTERANAGTSKELEWGSALGIMVTLVWLYLEMLRLLGKLRGN